MKRPFLFVVLIALSSLCRCFAANYCSPHIDITAYNKGMRGVPLALVGMVEPKVGRLMIKVLSTEHGKLYTFQKERIDIQSLGGLESLSFYKGSANTNCIQDCVAVDGGMSAIKKEINTVCLNNTLITSHDENTRQFLLDLFPYAAVQWPEEHSLPFRR